MFANAVGARVCSMAVNFRGRLPGLTEAEAGNYEGLMCLGPEAFAAPGGVRARLRSLATPAAPSEALPGFWECLGARLAVITSWAFEGDPSLEGCQMLLHLPHFDLGEVNSDMAVVFRPGAGRLAVLTFSKELDMDRALGSSVGTPLCREVFREAEGAKKAQGAGGRCEALLMLEQGLTFEEAWSFCERKRPIVYPNVGFQQQLKHLEKIMGKVVDFKAPWPQQIKQLREALPKGDLEGPKSPLPIREAIGSVMDDALVELEKLVEKVLDQPQLLQQRELWKRQGLFFENLHKYKAIPGDLALLGRAKTAAEQLRSLQRVYSQSLKGVQLANAVAQELEDWSRVAAPELQRLEDAPARAEAPPKELSKKQKKQLKKEHAVMHN
ncbi:unnamed protein product [Effrenium voratum]|nr:unnamed protein product [Effrenium voratum]